MLEEESATPNANIGRQGDTDQTMDDTLEEVRRMPLKMIALKKAMPSPRGICLCVCALLSLGLRIVNVK